MKTLFLILIFTDGTAIKINHKPSVKCEQDARILNRPEFLMMYSGEKVPDGRVIESAEWVCK